MKHFRFIWLGAFLAISAGCKGGGSDRAGTFERFSAIDPNSTVRIDGSGRVAQYETGAGGVTLGEDQEIDASVFWTTDNAGALDVLEVQTDPADPFSSGFGAVDTGATVGVDAAPGDSVLELALLFAVADAGAGFIVLESADRDELGFFEALEHQTFGIWANGLNAGAGVVGAAAVGSATPAAGVPGAGTATYTGDASGFYVDASGTDFITLADFSAAANFDTSSLNVATSNTTAVNVGDGSTAAMPSLNFSGAGATGQPFSVNVATAGPAPILSGTLSGQFFGPNAEEIGGTFDMTGAGGRYMGAVGGVR